MRLLICVFFLSFFPVETQAQIKIVGPTTVTVGDDNDYQVEGLTEAVVKAKQASVFYFPKDRVRVKPIITWFGMPEITFRARNVGKYMLAVSATINGQHQSNEIEITAVKEDEDEDDGDDTDPPIPPIPGEMTVVVIRETHTHTPKHEVIIQKLEDYVQSKGYWWRNKDQNVKDALTELPPVYLKPYLEAAKGHLLPVVIRGSINEDGVHSSDVIVRRLPASAEESINLVKDWEK